MRTPINRLVAFFTLSLLTCAASAATNFVWQQSPNPGPPYSDWSTAAHTIQDAVDAASPGDTVLVTNGFYATGGKAVYGFLTNRVAIDKPLTVRSLNGPQFTLIQGHRVTTTNSVEPAVRGVYLMSGAVLDGFTLTNSAALRCCAFDEQEESGGGLYCESTEALATNCVIAGNLAYQNGGGAYSGTLNNCTLADNRAPTGGAGGGAYRSILNGCTLRDNYAINGAGASDSALNNCTLTANRAESGGGAYRCTLTNCALTANYGGYGGGAYDLNPA
jgi:parallel beta-helix repeat protein